jgi:hypothetical protein
MTPNKSNHEKQMLLTISCEGEEVITEKTQHFIHILPQSIQAIERDHGHTVIIFPNGNLDIGETSYEHHMSIINRWRDCLNP